MNTKLLLAVAMAALAVPLSIAPAAAQSASMAHSGPARGQGSYQDLLGVWAEFRTWRGGWQARTPDWSAAGMAAERAAMATYLARVENMNVAAMDRGQRAEWLAARAKMLEHHFLLDVAKPWERDPGFYVDKMLDIGFAELPATGEALAKLKTRLADVPTLTATARANLKNVPGDYADLALHNIDTADGVGHGHPYRPVPPAGSRVVSSPTSTASSSRSGRLRRQIRRGRPLTRVSRSSRPTRASRQRGPARIGVTRKATVQASLSRGSIRFSQLPRPGPPSSTYWPIGSWRSQSIQRPRPVERASSFSASRCCLPRQKRRIGDPSKPRPSRICRST